LPSPKVFFVRELLMVRGILWKGLTNRGGQIPKEEMKLFECKYFMFGYKIPTNAGMFYRFELWFVWKSKRWRTKTAELRRKGKRYDN
jgi:hypothetical protein